ncbi:TonB family protein [Achromobacter deleyi]|uniref:TonB family protein n=1 Tax=Achromobacter deleyi TaxID=1353891 RepID=UPI00149265E3|nr:TonB family protein [Achromobacter deleyi]QVQ24719.1 TonB family protein [Achromobacter deleyi]UIP20255.1 TonB family protein [Achromobacter deleyi]
MFDVLGIEPTRDSKTIRRAYAAALKQIDQQTQLAAFERLRAAYERALEWARHQHEAAPSDMPAESETAVIASPPPPHASAIDFRQRQPQEQVQADADGPHDSLQMAREQARAVEQWVQRLMHAQDSELDELWSQLHAAPALMHLDAAEELSAALLRALTQHPDGRMRLYRDANARYGWNHAVLQSQGRRATPPLVEQLEHEDAIWRSHQRLYRKSHERVIRLLRRKPAPSWHRARRTIPHIQRMRRQVPLWLALQVPPGRQQAYFDAAMRVPRWARILDSAKASVWRWRWVVLIAIPAMAVSLIDMHSEQQYREERARATPTSIAPVNKKENERYTLHLQSVQSNGYHVYLIKDATAPSAAALPRRLLVPSPSYPIAARRARQEGTALVGINISRGGAINAWIARSSGSPDLDHAAMITIRRALAEGDFPASGLELELALTFKLPGKQE